MATSIRKVAPGDQHAQLAQLCRAADRATRANGLSTTVLRVDDKLFVARGIAGDPRKDAVIRQTIASNTEGGSFWFGHIEGRGQPITAIARVAGFALGGASALMTGLNLALGLKPEIAIGTQVITMIMGATIFGLSAMSLRGAHAAEHELDQLVEGGTAMPVGGGWTYGGGEVQKRRPAFSLAPGVAVPAPAAVNEPERVAV